MRTLSPGLYGISTGIKKDMQKKVRQHIEINIAKYQNSAQNTQRFKVPTFISLSSFSIIFIWRERLYITRNTWFENVVLPNATFSHMCDVVAC
jgi:hypothetical protein